MSLKEVLQIKIKYIIKVNFKLNIKNIFTFILYKINYYTIFFYKD